MPPSAGCGTGLQVEEQSEKTIVRLGSAGQILPNHTCVLKCPISREINKAVLILNNCYYPLLLPVPNQHDHCLDLQP
jgi:hypothetical protein